MKNILLVLALMLLSGCAICVVRVKPTGEWSAYGGSVLKEINIPSVGITNSTTSIYVNGYKTTNDTAKELVKAAVDKAF